LLVGERTAEQIKMEIGSAYPLEKPLTMEVKGRNLIEGVPRTVTIDDSEIRESLGGMRGHHFECHPRGAGTDATGAVRGH